MLEAIDTTVATWVKEQGSENDIVQRVRAELNGALRAITLYAIGIKRNSFDDSQVEIETRSPGYALLKGKTEEAAKVWLEENFDAISNTPTGSEIDSLKRHFIKEYDQYIRKAIGQKAEEKATQDAQLIINRVGLTTDKMRAALEDVITEEERAAAVEEAARGKEFLQRTKLKSASVRGVVAYDGKRLSDLIQEPDANCWHVVQLVSGFGDVDCHVLTNGKEWHPFEPSFGDDGLDCANSCVAENFGSSRQMIFNFLDEADRLFIAQAIADHYRQSNG